MTLNLEELRRSGVSSTMIGRITNPIRRALFRMALPYFEVIGRSMQRGDAESRAVALPPPELSEARLVAATGQVRAAALAAVYDDALPAVRDAALPIVRDAALAAVCEAALPAVRDAALAGVREDVAREIAPTLRLTEQQIAEATIRVREDALAGVRAETRREIAGTRGETLALSHRYAKIEQTLEVIKTWLGGLQEQASSAAAEVKSELAGLRERIETAERLGGAGGSAEQAALGGTPLRLAAGPYGRFLVRHPDVVGDAIIRGEFWDPHLRTAIEAHADPDRIAIDAGAYIGFHSVFLSHHFARVHAFEPQGQAFNLLCANIELNGRRNVEASPIGLYSHPCWLRLAPDEQQEIPIPRGPDGIDYAAIGNSAALAFVKAEERTAEAVRAVTIDSLDLDRVGFIKIDTQGADLQVLRGAEETIRRCRPVVAFEFERELSGVHATGWGDIASFFDELGYRLTEARRTEDGKQADFVAVPAR